MSEKSTKEQLQSAATKASQEGAATVTEGVEMLQEAGDAATVSRIELAEGASEATRGADAAFFAQRVARLGEVVGEAGARDVAQGAIHFN